MHAIFLLDSFQEKVKFAQDLLLSSKQGGVSLTLISVSSLMLIQLQLCGY